MDKETKDALQSIDATLKRIEIILSRMDSKISSKSSEELYEKLIINQTFA